MNPITATEAAREARISIPAFRRWAARYDIPTIRVRIGRSTIAVYDADHDTLRALLDKASRVVSR